MKLLMLLPRFIKTEAEDEMSEYNKNKAKSNIDEVLSLLISVCTLITIFKGVWMVDLRIILPFVVGGINLFECILFAVYERVGF